jgi:hypothetical protein
MVVERYSYITCGCGKQFQVLISTGEFDEDGFEIFIEDPDEAYRQYEAHECVYMTGEGI